MGETYLSNLYPCSRDSARIVFVEVARQPNKAAQNPNTLKLSSVTEVKTIPPTIGINEAHILQSKYFFQISHCKTTVSIASEFSHSYQKKNKTKKKLFMLTSKHGLRSYLTCCCWSKWLYGLHKRDRNVT